MRRPRLVLAALVVLAATLPSRPASATLIAGWDFSQYFSDSILSTDGISDTGTLASNYSNLDPTFSAGAESAAFGRMYIDGEYGSTAVLDSGVFPPDFHPFGPSLDANRFGSTGERPAWSGALRLVQRSALRGATLRELSGHGGFCSRRRRLHGRREQPEPLWRVLVPVVRRELDDRRRDDCDFDVDGRHQLHTGIERNPRPREREPGLADGPDDLRPLVSHARRERGAHRQRGPERVAWFPSRSRDTLLAADSCSWASLQRLRGDSATRTEPRAERPTLRNVVSPIPGAQKARPTPDTASAGGHPGAWILPRVQAPSYWATLACGSLRAPSSLATSLGAALARPRSC